MATTPLSETSFCDRLWVVDLAAALKVCEAYLGNDRLLSIPILSNNTLTGNDAVSYTHLTLPTKA